MLTKMLNVNIRPYNLQRFSWFNMCEHPELGSFACDAGSRSKSCSSGISTLSELITVRRCRRFLRTTLKSVWMTYARRVGLLAMTFPFPFLFILSADLTSHELSLHVSRQSTEGIDTLINLQCWSNLQDINTTLKEPKSEWSCSRRQLFWQSAIFSVSEIALIVWLFTLLIVENHMVTIYMGKNRSVHGLGRFKTIQNW